MADRPERRGADRYVSIVRHRVPFYETDAMGVVHHANYVHWLEVARGTPRPAAPPPPPKS